MFLGTFVILNIENVNFIHSVRMSKLRDQQTKIINPFKLPAIEGGTAYLNSGIR